MAGHRIIVAFRPMQDSDIGTLTRWLRTPAVAEWWRDEAAMSFDELAQKMTPRILHEEKVSPFIFSINGDDAGYVQSYLKDDWPDSHEMHRIPNAAGVDILIGEERWLHKGHGAQVLREFVTQHIFTIAKISTCLIDPEVTNVIAIRAYEKAGFTPVQNVVSSEDGRTYTIMRMDRH